MIHFDEATHTYTVEGRRLPSVTEILAPIRTDFSAVDPAVLEVARTRGVAIDRMIELHESGALDYSSVTPEMAAYLEVWEKIKTDTGLKVMEVQERVANPHYGYAGTLDLRVHMFGKVSIVDVKCTASGVPGVGPQTAAYAKGDHGIPRFALYLRPNASGKIVGRLDPLTDRNDWNVFLACLTIHRFKTKR